MVFFAFNAMDSAKALNSKMKFNITKTKRLFDALLIQKPKDYLMLY